MGHDELYEELSLDFGTPEKVEVQSADDRRIILGFEDIQRFVREHQRLPLNAPECDIFERMCAVRLHRIQELTSCHDLLAPYDTDGLIAGTYDTSQNLTVDDLNIDDLAAELQDFAFEEITTLKYVRSPEERKAAEDIAHREKCEDFEQFEAIFESINRDLSIETRTTVPYSDDPTVNLGDFFILGGQVAYVAEKGEEYEERPGRLNARLRVIFDNKTQSNLLWRSLQRALSQDDTSRRITKPDDGPLFRGEWEHGDQASGTIYVVRSLSDHPTIQAQQDLIHKIGVTSGTPERRIANAQKDPTFLLAPVELVATYTLVNVPRTKFEQLLHRFFASAQLNLTIHDRFGQPIHPREWFLVPLSAIEDAIDRIMDGTIGDWKYDPAQARLVKYKGDAP